MNPSAPHSPSSRSWKEIRQGVNARAMSREGRRRQMLALTKAIAACVVLAGFAWAGIELYFTWKLNPTQLKDAGPSVPLKQVVYSTDGVLDRTWLDQALQLPRNPSLMKLDLAALEARLLASGQVQTVVLRRRFTDSTLVVTLTERTPVARLMAQVGDEPAHALLVAADGVLYEGSGYAAPAVGGLPWLDGVRLRRTARGFEPIEGMDRVAALLAAAHGLVPEHAAGWDVVSLARLGSDQEIRVHSREIPEIIFDAHGDFARQLARLDHIVSFLHARGAPPMQRVNFALGNQVPVELQDAAPFAPARPHPPSATRHRSDF